MVNCLIVVYVTAQVAVPSTTIRVFWDRYVTWTGSRRTSIVASSCSVVLRPVNTSPATCSPSTSVMLRCDIFLHRYMLYTQCTTDIRECDAASFLVIHSLSDSLLLLKSWYKVWCQFWTSSLWFYCDARSRSRLSLPYSWCNFSRQRSRVWRSFISHLFTSYATFRIWVFWGLFVYVFHSSISTIRT